MRVMDYFYDHVDPEYADASFKANKIRLQEKIKLITEFEVIDKLKIYFSNIRKGLRLILERIKEYWDRPERQIQLEE